MNLQFRIFSDIGKNIIIFLLKAYKNLLSPLLGNNCRFYPTCSVYTMEAVGKYGVIKGLFKGLYRILRCNPFSKGGFDPP